MRSHEIAIETIPWAELALQLATAEDYLARLDERLAKSPIRDGWIERTHFAEACATMWLEGELVHVEDLVLHDAHMDVRTPTPELTRASAILRSRRRIAEASPSWSLSLAGLTSLLGRPSRDSIETGIEENARRAIGEGNAIRSDPDAGLADAFAAIDAAMVRVDRAIAREPQNFGSPVKTEQEIERASSTENDDADLTAWQSYVRSCQHLPPTLAAALAIDAWERLEPAPQTPWLGQMLAASILRERGKSRWHMPCLYEGSKAIERAQRQSPNPKTRLIAHLDAIAAAATAGLSQHDRWLTTRNLLARKLDGRRSTSRLPELLDYVVTRPIVSTKMISDELGVTQRAAQDLVATLGLREMTGRGRYRAWGIL